jgi:hypothetical protein
VQILQADSLLRAQLRERRQDRAAERGSAVRRLSRSLTSTEAIGSALQRSACRRQLRRCLEPASIRHCGSAGAPRNTGVVRDDAAAGDDTARVHRIDLFRICVEMTMILSAPSR